MKVIVPNCPSCGASYDGPIRGGVLTCEYCGSLFAFESDELQALGVAGDSSDDANEYSVEDLPPVDEFTREACEEFLRKVGSDEFQCTDKIKNGLGIDDYEEVFLIHDDTLMKSGKNGFAITDYGFYCREMGDSEAHYLKWGELAEAGKPHIDGSLIMAGGTSVAYFTGRDGMREELQSLYRKLRKYARNFDWVD